MEDRTTELTKVCSKCGEAKPVSEFYRDKRWNGLRPHCRACFAAYGRAWTAKNPEKAREYSRRWRAENPEKMREHRRKWREENPEKERENDRRRYAENPEKGRARSRKHRKGNLEKVSGRVREWQKQNPEKAREASRRWRKQNPDKRRESGRRRRARKANAEGSHTIEDMRRQYKVQKGKCWWCGKKVKWEDRHDDHLIPLSKGGTNWPSNIVASCAKCNCSKGSKTPDEFSGRLF